MKAGRIPWLLKAPGEFPLPDFIHVGSPVIFGAAISGKQMPRQNYRVVVVRQHIFDVFLKGAARNLHRLACQIVQPLSAGIGTRDSARSGHVEFEVIRTCLQVPVDVTSTKCGIRFSDRCL